MIIDHLERTITVKPDEIKIPGIENPTVEDIDQTGIIFYMTIEYSGKIIKNSPSMYSPEYDVPVEIPEIIISMKSMAPAYHYLCRFDIHDYKVILEEKKKNDKEN